MPKDRHKTYSDRQAEAARAKKLQAEAKKKADTSGGAPQSGAGGDKNPKS